MSKLNSKKGLNELKKRPRPLLVKMAKGLGIKVSVRWTRPVLAQKILEKQKLNELNDEQLVQPGPSPEPEPESKRKPDFESLASEAPEIEPESPQVEEPGRGGYREGAGRTPGLTDEKARVQRILKNEVPDPVVQYVVECFFSLAGEPKKKVVEPTPEMIAVPATNLISYYFPSLRMSPVLEMWIGLAIGVDAVVRSRIAVIRETRAAESKAEPEPEPEPVEES